MAKEIQHELKKRVLVLDGAMGTMLQKYSLSETEFRGERFAEHKYNLKGCNDVLCLTQPDIIKEIHEKYLKAGADIIETNTFNANHISLADYGLEKDAYEINYVAAQLAREKASKYSNITRNKPRFVAGSIGPTNKTASMSPDVNDPSKREVDFDALVFAYTEQVKGLLAGNVDVILIETIFDTLNAKAALFAVQTVMEKRNRIFPVMISGTITDKSGRTLTGQTVEAFLNSLSHVELLSIGFNCSFGAKDLFLHVEELSSKAPFFVSAYPNAGLPNELGLYDETPEKMQIQMKDFLTNKIANIIGGCCGTTPEHIQKLVEIAEKAKPREIPQEEKILKLSGLEPLNLYKENTFINIGERTNVAGSKKFAKLINQKKYDEAISVARQQIEVGAQIIDISMDDAMLDSEKEMVTFLKLVATEPEISKVPIMIDSSNWNVIIAALKCIQGKSIVNSISLKDGETEFINKAKEIKKYGAAIVVMAFDEKGQATDYQQKIDLCKRAYDILTKKVNFKPQDIIFDPNILTIATGIEEHNNYAVDFINATKWIKENLPYARVSGGISNLSFAFRGNNTVREAIHSVFLFYAIQAGLDMGIVNAGALPIYDDIPKNLLELVENVVLNKTTDATEKLIIYAQNVKEDNTKKEDKQEQWRSWAVLDRIKYSLIKGISDFVKEDVSEAQVEFKSALALIEGPLMEAMNMVGEKFGEGKMFLPQVVKSARVMKKAVDVLMPYLQIDGKLAGMEMYSGKILLATVKGDVHDIGKNIVSVVLGCNNFKIIDLGVMVPVEKIIEAAIRENVDIIGLSGLITPSLEEMITVAKEMERNNIKLPLLIGGATTSKIHTAVKIAPAYSGHVIHVTDASKSVSVAKNLINKESNYADNIRTIYDGIREKYIAKERIVYPLTFVRENKIKLNWTEREIIEPSFKGVRTFKNFSIEEISKYIDWTFFFHAWGLNGKYPQILDHPQKAEEAKKLMKDAQEMLKQIIDNQMLVANGVIAIYPANSDGDDIIVYKDETTKEEIARFSFLRQQEEKDKDSKYSHFLSLADFVAPKSSGLIDYIGGFAATAGIFIEEWLEKYEKDKDDYSAIMLKILADRLAEAFAELMHFRIRKDFWAYSKEENISIAEMIKMEYRGIRPAIGYPACPDHSEKQMLFKLLDANVNTGILLTENYGMYPAASVSGFYFANTKAQYFNLGKIDKDQVIDYARRKNIDIDRAEKLLAPILNYS